MVARRKLDTPTTDTALTWQYHITAATSELVAIPAIMAGTRATTAGTTTTAVDMVLAGILYTDRTVAVHFRKADRTVAVHSHRVDRTEEERFLAADRMAEVASPFTSDVKPSIQAVDLIARRAS